MDNLTEPLTIRIHTQIWFLLLSSSS